MRMVTLDVRVLLVVAPDDEARVEQWNIFALKGSPEIVEVRASVHVERDGWSCTLRFVQPTPLKLKVAQNKSERFTAGAPARRTAVAKRGVSAPPLWARKNVLDVKGVIEVDPESVATIAQWKLEEVKLLRFGEALVAYVAVQFQYGWTTIGATAMFFVPPRYVLKVAQLNSELPVGHPRLAATY